MGILLMFKGLGLVFFLILSFIFFEIESHSVAQTAFELVILLSQPIRYQDCRCVPLCMAPPF